MSTRRQGGMTLIELVIAIVIISVGLAGVLIAFSTVVMHSADPLVRKQMLSIAEEMMEEITLQPFAVSGAPPANSAADCRAGTSVAPRQNFDDVADFNGYQTTGICDVEGTAIQDLAGYNLNVSVNSAGALGTLGGGSVKKITVTVTHGTESLQLVGWRTNYAN